MHLRGYPAIMVLIVVIFVLGIIAFSSVLKIRPLKNLGVFTQHVYSTLKVAPSVAIISPKPTPDIYGLEPPLQYQKLLWNKVVKGSEVLNTPTLTWSTLDDKQNGEVVIPGTEWIANETISSEKESFPAVEIYYQEELFKAGWRGAGPPFVINNYKFYDISGGGVSVNYDGYHKVFGSDLRVVRYSEQIPSKYIRNPGQKMVYPYPVIHRVFISDIVTFNQLIDLIR